MGALPVATQSPGEWLGPRLLRGEGGGAGWIEGRRGVAAAGRRCRRHRSSSLRQRCVCERMWWGGVEGGRSGVSVCVCGGGSPSEKSRPCSLPRTSAEGEASSGGRAAWGRGGHHGRHRRSVEEAMARRQGTPAAPNTHMHPHAHTCACMRHRRCARRCQAHARLAPPPPQCPSPTPHPTPPPKKKTTRQGEERPP